MMSLVRRVTTLGGLLLAWQFIVWVTDVPGYILPGPLAVADAFATHAGTLAQHATVTIIEILAGLLLGALLGFFSALSLSSFHTVRRWLLPVLVISQALPVFGGADHLFSGDRCVLRRVTPHPQRLAGVGGDHGGEPAQPVTLHPVAGGTAGSGERYARRHRSGTDWCSGW
jgi:hypothetical protein